jgi:hypothetical protein
LPNENPPLVTTLGSMGSQAARVVYGERWKAGFFTFSQFRHFPLQ